MANRNKRAGSNHERDEVTAHKRYFKDVATTRLCNRSRDNCGIDICNQDEFLHGRLPIDISCKSAVLIPAFPKLLDEMGSPEGNIKVILYRRTRKSEGGKFMVKGEYAITDRAGYEQFLQHVYAIQILRKKLPEIIAELEKNYDLNLLNIPQQVVL
jgi:hypothetical protein